MWDGSAWPTWASSESVGLSAVGLALEHSPDGRIAEVQAGPGEHLGDLDLAQGGTERLEALDDVADEVGELVDRLSELYQRG